MPLVSVIVPNYNHQQYLGKRIDTVLGQTFQDFELIILDDCSTDDSRKVIQLYESNPKISHIIYNTVNSNSTFKQWEKGIALAQGKYIWIAESDDWCEPSLLQVLVDALEADTNCVFAYTQSHIVNSHDEIMWQTTHSKVAEYINGHSFIQQYMLLRNAVFNASMALFRKSVYSKVSPAYTGFKFCGDWLFWIEAALQGNVFISGRVLNYFKKHDQDVTGKMYAIGYNFVEELTVLKVILDRGLIDEPAYKTALIRKYINYRYIRKRLNADVVRELDRQFFMHNNISYKSYLKSRQLAKTIKNNGSKFLRWLVGAQNQ